MAEWIEPDPILREIKKSLITVDLSAGEHPEIGFKKIRSLQTFEDYKEALNAVMRKVKRRAEKEHWKPFCYYAVISNKHLSDNSTGEELGKDKSRVCNWHIHMILYSPEADLDTLKSYGNKGARYYWTGQARAKTNGRDKGGYNFGGASPDLNPWAEKGVVLKWYYTNYQAYKDNYTCAKWDGKKFTMMKKSDFHELMEKEWEKLTPEQKERAEKRKAKWRARSQDCDAIIANNERLMINVLATPVDYILTQLEANGIDSTGLEVSGGKDLFVQKLLIKHKGYFSRVVQGTNTGNVIEYGITKKQYALAVELAGRNAGAILRELSDRADVKLLDKVRQYILYNIELDSVEKDGVTWIIEKGEEGNINRVKHTKDS